MKKMLVKTLYALVCVYGFSAGTKLFEEIIDFIE